VVKIMRRGTSFMATRVYQCLKEIGDKIMANKDFLTDLDREIGDADHGVNMARGFAAVVEKVPEDEGDIGAALKKTGMTLLSTVGGASGPLYGTAYMEAAKVFAGKTAVSPEDFKAALEAAIAGIQKRGKAVKGEKTMLDALMPAYDAFSEKVDAGADLNEALDAACAAAAEGVEYTKTIAATKGRASYLGQRSVGHQDPGATSATLTLETIRDFLKG
jgi:dihydroxyacetone kinase-like protein